MLETLKKIIGLFKNEFQTRRKRRKFKLNQEFSDIEYDDDGTCAEDVYRAYPNLRE
ncbi:MAG: hypothetical protein AAGF07_01065 [Patescibacteria group bacterium]